MSRILVTGSASGLGLALFTALVAAGHEVVGYDLVNGQDVREPQVEAIGELDILINCAGINGIALLEDLDDTLWSEVMDTNVTGIMRMSRALLPQLIASKGTILNIVSRAATTPMTGSAAYNSSKGAALILTRQMARELTKLYDITVFSVSPNKLRGTKMSDYIDNKVAEIRNCSLAEAIKYSESTILAKEETPVHLVADFITYLLASKENHKYLTGVDLTYGNQ